MYPLNKKRRENITQHPLNFLSTLLLDKLNPLQSFRPIFHALSISLTKFLSIYRLFPENGYLRDRWIVFIVRVYNADTVFMTPIVSDEMLKFCIYIYI